MRLQEPTESSDANRKQQIREAGAVSDDHANVNFPPPLIHLLGGAAGLAMSVIYPLQIPQLTLLWWLGLGLMSVALILAAMGFREFSQAGNPVPPNRQIEGLMTGGPFRFSRNPLYLALALFHAGIALVIASVWLLLSLIPVLFLVRYYVIEREEAYLKRRFGQVYLEYQRHVRRWI